MTINLYLQTDEAGLENFYQSHNIRDYSVVVYSHRKMKDDPMVKMVISGKLKVIEISLLPLSIQIHREKYRLDRLIPWFSS